MKKMKMILILMAIALRGYSPGNNVVTIGVPPPIDAWKPYEAIWNASAKGESNLNPFAVGDKHLKKHSYGIVQIRESRLKDFNMRTGKNYTVKDLFDVNISKEIFMFYATQNHPDSIEVICREWNGGSKGMQNPDTYNYYLYIKSKL